MKKEGADFKCAAEKREDAHVKNLKHLPVIKR
jgi:hypothetical protein